MAQEPHTTPTLEQVLGAIGVLTLPAAGAIRWLFSRRREAKTDSMSREEQLIGTAFDMMEHLRAELERERLVSADLRKQMQEQEVRLDTIIDQLDEAKNELVGALREVSRLKQELRVERGEE